MTGRGGRVCMGNAFVGSLSPPDAPGGCPLPEGSAMPLYPYHCPKCGKDFEVEMRLSEVGKKKVSCPGCKGRKVERVYSAFFAKTSRKS